MNSAATCPLCSRPAADAHRPFCSRGCKDRDLLKWLDGRYAVAGSLEEDAAGPDADPGMPQSRRHPA